MFPASSLASPPVRQQVLRIIGRRAPVRQRLQRNLHLVRELYFDLLDIVNVILDLERCFHISIPDEVPFVTVGDFVDYVAAELLAPRR